MASTGRRADGLPGGGGLAYRNASTGEEYQPDSLVWWW